MFVMYVFFFKKSNGSKKISEGLDDIDGFSK